MHHRHGEFPGNSRMTLPDSSDRQIHIWDCFWNMSTCCLCTHFYIHRKWNSVVTYCYCPSYLFSWVNCKEQLILFKIYSTDTSMIITNNYLHIWRFAWTQIYRKMYFIIPHLLPLATKMWHRSCDQGKGSIPTNKYATVNLWKRKITNMWSNRRSERKILIVPLWLPQCHI